MDLLISNIQKLKGEKLQKHLFSKTTVWSKKVGQSSVPHCLPKTKPTKLK